MRLKFNLVESIEDVPTWVVLFQFTDETVNVIDNAIKVQAIDQESAQKYANQYIFMKQQEFPDIWRGAQIFEISPME